MVRTQDQRIMWASASSSVEHLGFAAHELVGLSILDVLESSSSTPLRHLFSGAQTADRRFDDLRVRIARAQGSVRDFELRSVRYVETGGQVLAFVRLLPLGVRADQGVNLAAAEHRYAALVRGASDGVVVHDGTRTGGCAEDRHRLRLGPGCRRERHGDRANGDQPGSRTRRAGRGRGCGNRVATSAAARLNCRLAQGWLFSRALPYDALIAAYGQPRGAATTSAPATSGPPPAANEAMRLAAFEACKILDTSTDEAFDSLVQLASQLLSTPMALISLVDADRQWFKARLGIDVTETPRNIAFCAHAIAEPHQPFIVPDTALDVRFASNPLVTGAPNIRSYAGIPILSREELPLGTLCVLDNEPRTFTDEQVGLLTMLAAEAAALLDLVLMLGTDRTLTAWGRVWGVAVL